MKMPSVRLSNGTSIPRLGLGTWRMGESPAMREREVSAVRHGLSRGITLIDTAEMYGDGVAEEIVAEAMSGQRSGYSWSRKSIPGTRRAAAPWRRASAA